MNSHQGRIAIVTGASSGIGLEIVRHLKNEAGLEIWLVARRKDRLDSLVNELSSVGVSARAIELDLSLSESWATLENHVSTSNKKIIWLVNNAGFGYSGLFEKESLKSVEGMIALNITALTSLTRRLLPYMGTGSHILNVASSIGFIPVSGYAVYAATKAYVLSFSLSLRGELKSRGISVSALCPGPVATEFFDSASVDAPPRFFIEDASNTAFLAVEKSTQGKAIIVTGFAALLARWAGALLPRAWIAALTSKVLKR